MIRIAGINIPDQKHIIIALTSIYGVGKTIAKAICYTANIQESKLAKKLSDGEILKIRELVSKIRTEGDLQRSKNLSIKRLTDLNCYRGSRHRKNLPVRGQRTKTNSRTRKGPRKLIKK